MAILRGVGQSGVRWKLHTRGDPALKHGTWRLENIEVVMANINAELGKMKAEALPGLTAAANYILTDADVGTSPLVPHDTGTLRSSRFTDPHIDKNDEPSVTLGYKVNYAAAVHEMLWSASGNPINWNRPGSGPKFFEASLKRNAAKIPGIVASHIPKR